MSAAAFRALHASFLALPNAWDVLSARIAEAAGARALGTSSAALAWSLGHPDGEALPLDALVGAVRALRRATTLPLSVDAERGYGRTPGEVAVTVARLVEAGAVGVNLEDGAGDAARFVDVLGEVRRRLGPEDLFLNARTCLALRRGREEAALVPEVLARARAYAAAGADGFFVPGLVEASALRTVAAGTALPLNALVAPGLPPPATLEAIGVRRLSLGPRWAAVAYTAASAVLGPFLAGTVPPELGAPALGYAHWEALARGD